MTIDAKITGRIDNQRIQIEIASKDSQSRYFAVPDNKADSFIKNYSKLDKRHTIIANGGFMGGIFAGILAASLATRKIKNTALRWGLNLAAGMVGAIGAIYGTSAYMIEQQDKLIKSHNAKEISY